MDERDLVQLNSAANEDDQRLHKIQEERKKKESQTSEAKAQKDELKRRKLQKNVFTWSLPERRKDDDTIRLDEVVDNGIPRKELLSYLGQEIRELESCRSLPFAVLLIGIYAASAIIHENAPQVSAVEYAMEFDVEENANFAWAGFMGHKTVYDVNSLVDWWSWFSLGFLPLVYIQATPFSEGLDINVTDDYRPTLAGVEPDEEFDDFFSKYTYKEQSIEYFGNDSRRGLYLNFNRLLGGVRLSKIDSMEPNGCESNEQLLKAYGMECVGGKGYELEPEVFDVWRFNAYGTEVADIKWLYAYKDLDTLQNEALQMETEGWLNNHTKRVEIVVPVFNAEYGLYSVMKVAFFFSRGGHIWKEVVTASTWSNWWREDSYYIVDFIFLGCMIFIIVKQMMDMKRQISKFGCAGLCHGYLTPWTSVDWISVIAAIALIGLFQINLTATSILNDAASVLGGINYALEENFARYEEAVKNTFEKLSMEIIYARTFRYFMAIFPCVIILRLFKAFSAQARLAIVTNTLYHASTDLVHFMIVFLSVFASYMISAVALLGRDVPEFTTPTRAMNQLFRALQGDLDWDEVKHAGRYEAMLFCFIFQILLSQIMFNILMAIIMDAYGEVKESLQGAEMLWEELGEEIRTRCGSKKNRQVKLTKVVEALSYDEKVDTLKKGSTRPKDNKTEFVVAQNAKNGKVSWECYSKTREHLCDEMDKAFGDIIVCDGMGKQILLSDGKLIEFTVKLDHHGQFYWYTDTTQELSKSAREDKSSKHAFEAAVQAAEDGLTASGMVTAEYLVKGVENMKEKQATNIICKAIETFYDANRKESEDDDLRNIVLHLEHRSTKLLKAVMGEPKRPKAVTNGEAEVAIKHRGTVGNELTKITKCVRDFEKWFNDSIFQEYDQAKFEADLELIKEQTATLEELRVDMEIKFVDSMRDIIHACADARLATENSDARKLCAGKHGVVVQRDLADRTVCVDVQGVGELWFAPAAIVSPNAWGPPTAAEIEVRNAEANKKEDLRDQRHFRRQRINRSREMTKIINGLKEEIRDAQALKKEAKEAKDELKRRVQRQTAAKAKAQKAVKTLKQKVFKLNLEDEKEEHISRHKLASLVHLTESRNDYFDTVRQLTAENNRLKADLEQATAANTVELSDLKLHAESIRLGEIEAKRTLQKLAVAAEEAARAEQRDLAWISGTTDSLIKKLTHDPHQSRTILQLMDLRNSTLEFWNTLQTM